MVLMIYYAERQRFTQKWLWALLLGTAGLFWYGAYRQLVLDDPWGSDPMSDGGLLGIWALVGIGLPALFFFGYLRTEVRDDGIYVRFAPFHRRYRCWRFDALETVTAREYSPLAEYAGWGMRWGPSGKAYSVRGRGGIQLVLASGERILIGTQDPEAFMAAVERAMAGGSGPP